MLVKSRSKWNCIACAQASFYPPPQLFTLLRLQVICDCIHTWEMQTLSRDFSRGGAECGSVFCCSIKDHEHLVGLFLILIFWPFLFLGLWHLVVARPCPSFPCRWTRQLLGSRTALNAGLWIGKAKILDVVNSTAHITNPKSSSIPGRPASHVA